MVQGVPRVFPQLHHHGGKMKLEGDGLRLLKILIRTIKFIASLLDELVRERDRGSSAYLQELRLEPAP